MTREAERHILKLKRTDESASKGVSRCAEPEPACSPAGPSVRPLLFLRL